MEDDLNTPQAIALMHNLFKDDAISNADKKKTLLEMDNIFGLNLNKIKTTEILEIPEEVTALVNEREEARKNKDWKVADELRDKIKSKGYKVKDTLQGPRIK